MRRVFIGTSGYTYKDWKGRFYPDELSQRKWLEFYAKQFNTVEINATFYGSFSQNTYENWASLVPDDFAFTIKGSRFITHVKRLHEVKEPLERFFEAASVLGEKFSCVLWQLPGNFKYKDENQMARLQEFLEQLPQTPHQTFEFRHESWFRDDIFKLLDKYKAGFVINDSSRYPWKEKITGDFAYIRFHGPAQLYASEYSEEEMENWAKKINRYKQQYPVYCYFNNDHHAFAIKNAIQLERFTSENNDLLE